ncbi:MAG: efflux RND transporter periplasmic adaptor subunit [Acidobacteriota bacterium]
MTITLLRTMNYQPLAAFLALSLLVGCSWESSPMPAAPEKVEGAPAPSQEAPTDLDRSVAELKAEVCEHEIPTYTCDECRYEVGVAKLPQDLLDPTKGGTVEVVTVGTRDVGGGKDLNGEVRSNEERSVFVSPVAAGTVRAIRVDLGGRVDRGQVLYEVDSTEFRQAKADHTRAASALDLARATEQRESELFTKGICPKRDLLEAQAALRMAEAEHRAAANTLASMGLSDSAMEALAGGADPSGLMPVRAPFSGVVLERSLSLGALVQPGDRALLLADTTQVWVQTTLYESEFAALLAVTPVTSVGAEVTLASYPGRVFRGRVDRIGGTLDEITRTATARVVVDNPDNLLRAGMFARVRLHLGDIAAAGLALPEESILEDEGRSFAFVSLEGPYYIRRPVTVGRREGGWTEIVTGVSKGDTVVSKGAFLLKSDVLRSKMGAGCAD